MTMVLVVCYGVLGNMSQLISKILLFTFDIFLQNLEIRVKDYIFAL